MNVVEYNFINPDRNRFFSIVSETMREHRKKYDAKKVDLKYNTKFYDKKKKQNKKCYI